MKGYFDYNATTPLAAVAREAWLRASEQHWHNPSSLYREAAVVSQLLESAQVAIADHLGAEEPERVIFNSGATEGNNAVLIHAARRRSGMVWISGVEHPSVSDSAQGLLPDRVKTLPVHRDAVVDLDALREVLETDSEKVALVSVMAANNECGVLQPWREALSLCRAHGVPFHCDAAQWIGKLPSEGLGACDYVTGSAHKLGGPKGTGFLLVPDGETGFRSLLGGPQQEGRRGGTENYPAIAAMVAAWDALEPRLPEVTTSGREARLAAEAALVARLPGLEIVGAEAERLWNTVLCILPGDDNRRWLTRLNRRGFAVSTGSACSSGKENPSRVLLATGHDHAAMKRTLRLSAGWDTTLEDWLAVVEALVEVAAELGVHH